jgi:hypothetical protein
MNERRANVIEKLTRAGRLLPVITILLFAGGFYVTFIFFGENFPAGSYPLVCMFMPDFLGSFFFFLAVAWLLERSGIRINAGKLVAKR